MAVDFLPLLGVSQPTTETLALKTGLRAYWKLDETTGTRVDSHTAGADLTDNNSTGSAAGIISNAAVIVAASLNHLSRTDTPAVSFSSTMTISTWVYLNSIPAGAGAIVGKDDGASNRDYALYIDSSGVVNFTTYGTGTTGNLAYGSAFSTSTWYHVLAWYDASDSTKHLQVNAGTVLDQSSSKAPSDGTGSFEIGLFQSAFYLNGRVDETALWDRVLNATERTQLYNSGSGYAYSNFT